MHIIVTAKVYLSRRDAVVGQLFSNEGSAAQIL
jgi:hypothetical protein